MFLELAWRLGGLRAERSGASSYALSWFSLRLSGFFRVPAHKNLIQGVHRRLKRQVKNPHAGPSAIRRRGLFFTAKQHRPRYGITRGRCCYFYLIKKMRTASVTAFSQKMLSFWLQPYHTVPHAKSQSLLSRTVYLCQFFLSSIENLVCMVRQFSVFYPITTSSSPGKPCHFVGQGLSNSQI